MAKLVAFYSRADENYFGGQYRYIEVGNTEKVANMISEITGADLFKIEQKEAYSADYQECIAEAKKDLQENKRPEVLNLPDNLDAYDEIYLGYPNYWGTMPMAVYTFLENYDFSGKKITLFATSGGSGFGKTVQELQPSAPGAEIREGKLLNSGSKQAIESWVKSL